MAGCTLRLKVVVDPVGNIETVNLIHAFIGQTVASFGCMVISVLYAVYMQYELQLYTLL